MTPLKPDIVIIDSHKETIHLYELTCPAEKNIEARHTEKSNKYAHFSTDITNLTCKVNCFEVSTKGFLNARNHSTLNTLHKFIKPSYYLFLCKNEPIFVESPYLLPPP